MKQFILTLISIIGAAAILSSCSPHTSPASNKRYHNWNKQGPDFPDVGNLGVSDSDCN